MGKLLDEFTQEGSVWIIKLTGDVASKLAEPIWLNELLHQLIQAQAHQLVIDLTHAEQFGSQALRHLLLIREEYSKRNIEIILRNPNRHLTRLFQILQMHMLFVIERVDDG